MSFQNANQAIQRFIAQRYRTVKYSSINAVLDARSQNSMIEKIWEIEGKKRTLKISYYPIVCDAATTCAADICTDGTAAEPVQEYFTLSRCIQSKVQKLNWNDVRDVDNNWNFSEHAMQQISAMLGSLRKELATQIDALLLANAGLQLDGNATKRVTIFNPAAGMVQPLGLWEIEKTFSDGAYTSPFIIGATEVFNWKKALGIAAPNNTTGQDYGQLTDSQMYYDPLLNGVAGDLANGEHIIAFDPEAIRFVTFNKNLGIFATDMGSPADFDRMFKRGGTDYAYGVITDPETGLIWDFQLNYDKCTEAFTWFLRLEWDIFFPKVQACNIQGVNGIFHFRTCPQVVTPCPTGESPVSPVAAQTYSWTPGAIYPLYIHQSTIGGVENQPNVNVTNIAELSAAMNDAYGTPGLFSVNGAAIEYSGYSAIAGSLNDGAITITFA